MSEMGDAVQRRRVGMPALIVTVLAEFDTGLLNIPLSPRVSLLGLGLSFSLIVMPGTRCLEPTLTLCRQGTSQEFALERTFSQASPVCPHWLHCTEFDWMISYRTCHYTSFTPSWIRARAAMASHFIYFFYFIDDPSVYLLTPILSVRVTQHCDDCSTKWRLPFLRLIGDTLVALSPNEPRVFS